MDHLQNMFLIDDGSASPKFLFVLNFDALLKFCHFLSQDNLFLLVYSLLVNKFLFFLSLDFLHFGHFARHLGGNLGL